MMCLQEIFLFLFISSDFAFCFQTSSVATPHSNACSISASTGIAQKGDTFHDFFPFLFFHHSPSLMETAALAQGKALLQSIEPKVAVKISSNRTELWHLSQLQGLFGVLKTCTWMIKMGVQPPLIHLARVTQHPCFASLLCSRSRALPEEAWLPPLT